MAVQRRNERRHREVVGVFVDHVLAGKFCKPNLRDTWTVLKVARISIKIFASHANTLFRIIKG